MRRPFNLAQRPFRNERLPTLVLGAACLALLAVTVRHVLAAWALLPEKTASVDGELVALEQEIARLRSESAELRRRTAPTEALREWAAVRELVDRRAFSWSALLGCLEDTMPPGIRLRSIAPGVKHGQLEVQLLATGRTVDDGLEFLDALRERGEFEDAFFTNVSEGREGIEIPYTMRYAPPRRGAAGAAGVAAGPVEAASEGPPSEAPGGDSGSADGGASVDADDRPAEDETADEGWTDPDEDEEPVDDGPPEPGATGAER